MDQITNSENIIRISDVTDRFEELLREREDHDEENGTERDADGKLGAQHRDHDGEPNAGTWEYENPYEAEELENLGKLLVDCAGHTGNYKWDGNWYPDFLIADDHFPTYAEEYANDSGAISRENASWIVIDWNATAEGLKQDFSSVDFDGVTYWYRG
jgi:hypothetical protein